MKSQTKIQVSNIRNGMRARICAMYIDVFQRIGTASNEEFEALMRRIHVMEIRLSRM